MKFRTPWLTLSLAALAAGLNFLPGAATALQFDRAALAGGELWRGLTAHLVHFNSSHLAWDLLMLVVLGAGAEQISRRGLALTLAFSAVLISGAVWLVQPEFATYRGLSGVDCALFGYLLMHILTKARRQSDQSMQLVTIAAGGFFLAKTYFEFTSGLILFADAHGDFVPVPLAHLVGFLCGLAVRLLIHPGPSNITPFYGSHRAVIPYGSNTPELAPAWSECRSLLAGDATPARLAGVPNRLQAGSYKR